MASPGALGVGKVRNGGLRKIGEVMDKDVDRTVGSVGRADSARLASVAALLEAARTTRDPRRAARDSREANQLLLTLHDSGLTGAQLGRMLGLSRERIRQRLNAARAQHQPHRGPDGTDPRHRAGTSPSGLMRPAEAARLVGLTQRTLRTLAINGHIDCVQIPGGHRRYPREALLVWAREHPTAPRRD